MRGAPIFAVFGHKCPVRRAAYVRIPSARPVSPGLRTRHFRRLMTFSRNIMDPTPLTLCRDSGSAAAGFGTLADRRLRSRVQPAMRLTADPVAAYDSGFYGTASK